MRININKFQAGGLVYIPNPLTPSNIITPEPYGGPDTNKLDPTQIFQGVDGISSDVDQLVQEKMKYWNAYNNLSNEFKNGIAGRSLVQKIVDPTSMVKAKRAKTEFDAVLADKKKAMPDFVSYQGNTIVHDITTGAVKEMSIIEYANNLRSEDPKYKALTNSEVADLRENDPRFAYNQNLVTFLQNATSTEDAVKEMKLALSNIGSYSKGTTSSTFQERQIEEGAEAALSGSYSLTQSTSGESEKSNLQNIKAAGLAAWANLSDGAKSNFLMKAAHMGYSGPELENAGMGLALSLLNPAITEQSITKELATPKGKGTAGSGSGSGSAKGTEELGNYKALAMGKGVPDDVTLINGTTHKMVAKGWTGAPFQDKTGKFYGITTLDEMPELGSIADLSNVYFGDQKVDVNKLNSVVYANGKPATVMLPFDVNAKNGDISPNLHRAQDLEDAKKEIQSNYGSTASPDIKKEIYRNHGFNTFNTNGEPDQSVELRPFLTFQGYSNDKSLDGNSIWVTQDPTKDNWYKSIYSDPKGKTINPTFNEYLFGLFRHPTTLVGMVYIPINKGAGWSANYADNTRPLIEKSMNMDEAYNTSGSGGKGQSPIFKQIDKSKTTVGSLNNK